jgi:hypothetical protein
VHGVLGLSARLVRGAGPAAGWMDRESVSCWVGFLLLATVLGNILDWWGLVCSVWFECDIDKRCDCERVMSVAYLFLGRARARVIASIL